MSEEQEFFESVGTSKSKNAGVATSTQPTADEHGENVLITNVGSYSAWAQIDNAFHGVAQTHSNIPSGVYRCEVSSRVGPLLYKQVVSTDNLFQLPDSASQDVIKEIIKFRNLKDNFKKYGYLHKRGILLWGPPGSGKTATVNLLSNLIINEENGIALFIDHPGAASQCLQLVRRIEPNRPIVAIFEDIDALVERYGENEYLSLLDGEAQVDNIVFVATTNYPERLDKRFVDRPSRFDTIKYVGMPNEAARRFYLLNKLSALPKSTVEKFVQESEGFSIAHLRELIILTQCFEFRVDDAIKRLRVMQTKPNSASSPDKPNFGFGN